MQTIELNIKGLRFFILKLLYVNVFKYKILRLFLKLDLNLYMSTQNVFRDTVSAKLLEAIHKTNDKLTNEIWVDVGANFGLFFTHISGYQNKKVIAFEPNTKLHIDYGQNFIWERFALSDQIGNFSFYISNDRTGASSLIKMKHHDAEINTKCIRFDDYEISEPNQITIIKIDVEGAEVSVLLGAKETINRNKPIILVETEFEKIAQIEKILPSYKLYYVTIPGLDFDSSKPKRFLSLVRTLLNPQPKIKEISATNATHGYIDNVFAIPPHVSLPNTINVKL